MTHHTDVYVGPATELIDQIYYSTNFYTAQTVKALQARNTSKPFWLHLTYQAVHEGNYQFNVRVLCLAFFFFVFVA